MGERPIAREAVVLERDPLAAIRQVVEGARFLRLANWRSISGSRAGGRPGVPAGCGVGDVAAIVHGRRVAHPRCVPIVHAQDRLQLLHRLVPEDRVRTRSTLTRAEGPSVVLSRVHSVPTSPAKLRSELRSNPRSLRLGWPLRRAAAAEHRPVVGLEPGLIVAQGRRAGCQDNAPW